MKMLNLLDEILENWVKKLKELDAVKHLSILFLIAIIFNIYPLANFSLSIDDETAAVRQSPEDWIAQGRWTIYLIERFVLPQPVMPFFPDLLFLIFLTISYYLILLSHCLKVDWRAYFIFPIFCCFPIWAFITAFYSNTPALGMGFMLVSLVVFLHFDKSQGADRDTYLNVGVFSILSRGLLLAIAIGCYQSLIMAYVVIAAGSYLYNLLFTVNRSDGIRHLKKGAECVLIAVTGSLLYVIINKIAQSQIASQDGSFWESYSQLDLFFKDPGFVISKVFQEIIFFYSGSIEKFGSSLSVLGIVSVLALIVCVNRFSKKSWTQVGISLFLMLIILITPFSLNLFSNGMMPTRTFVGIPYVVFLMILILMSVERLLFKGIAVILSLSLLFQVVSINSLYAATGRLALDHDRSLAYQIYDRIGQLTPDYKKTHQTLFLDVYGKKSVINPFASMAKAYSTTIGASFFEWDGGNIWRMAIFMKLLGLENIQPVDSEQRKRNTEAFKEMSVWPAKGAVQLIGDTFLVKLSEEPDPGHVP